MDKHHYYQNAVQCVEAEIDFVESTYLELKGKPARKLREDFCGTAQTACEWIKRDEQNTAYGVDLDPLVLQWGEDNNLAQLKPQQRQRIQLLHEEFFENEMSAEKWPLIKHQQKANQFSLDLR